MCHADVPKLDCVIIFKGIANEGRARSKLQNQLGVPIVQVGCATFFLMTLTSVQSSMMLMIMVLSLGTLGTTCVRNRKTKNNSFKETRG